MILKPDSIPHILAEGELGAVLEWIVKDPQGRIWNFGQRRSESFYPAIFTATHDPDDAGGLRCRHAVKDTGNTLRTLMSNTLNFIAGAAANDATYGIQVGTGNNAPTITDYVIQSLITHGSGAGSSNMEA
jgi:hypothetical protein